MNDFPTATAMAPSSQPKRWQHSLRNMFSFDASQRTKSVAPRRDIRPSSSTPPLHIRKKDLRSTKSTTSIVDRYNADAHRMPPLPSLPLSLTIPSAPFKPPFYSPAASSSSSSLSASSSPYIRTPTSPTHTASHTRTHTLPVSSSPRPKTAPVKRKPVPSFPSPPRPAPYDDFYLPSPSSSSTASRRSTRTLTPPSERLLSPAELLFAAPRTRDVTLLPIGIGRSSSGGSARSGYNASANAYGHGYGFAGEYQHQHHPHHRDVRDSGRDYYEYQYQDEYEYEAYDDAGADEEREYRYDQSRHSPPPAPAHATPHAYTYTHYNPSTNRIAADDASSETDSTTSFTPLYNTSNFNPKPSKLDDIDATRSRSRTRAQSSPNASSKLEVARNRNKTETETETENENNASSSFPSLAPFSSSTSTSVSGTKGDIVDLDIVSSCRRSRSCSCSRSRLQARAPAPAPLIIPTVSGTKVDTPSPSPSPNGTGSFPDLNSRSVLGIGIGIGIGIGCCERGSYAREPEVQDEHKHDCDWVLPRTRTRTRTRTRPRAPTPSQSRAARCARTRSATDTTLNSDPDADADADGDEGGDDDAVEAEFVFVEGEGEVEDLAQAQAQVAITNSELELRKRRRFGHIVLDAPASDAHLALSRIRPRPPSQSRSRPGLIPGHPASEAYYACASKPKLREKEKSKSRDEGKFRVGFPSCAEPNKDRDKDCHDSGGFGFGFGFDAIDGEDLDFEDGFGIEFGSGIGFGFSPMSRESTPSPLTPQEVGAIAHFAGPGMELLFGPGGSGFDQEHHHDHDDGAGDDGSGSGRDATRMRGLGATADGESLLAYTRDAGIGSDEDEDADDGGEKRLGKSGLYGYAGDALGLRRRGSRIGRAAACDDRGSVQDSVHGNKDPEAEADVSGDWEVSLVLEALRSGTTSTDDSGAILGSPDICFDSPPISSSTHSPNNIWLNHSNGPVSASTPVMSPVEVETEDRPWMRERQDSAVPLSLLDGSIVPDAQRFQERLFGCTISAADEPIVVPRPFRSIPFVERRLKKRFGFALLDPGVVPRPNLVQTLGLGPFTQESVERNASPLDRLELTISKLKDHAHSASESVSHVELSDLRVPDTALFQLQSALPILDTSSPSKRPLNIPLHNPSGRQAPTLSTRSYFESPRLGSDSSVPQHRFHMSQAQFDGLATPPPLPAVASEFGVSASSFLHLTPNQPPVPVTPRRTMGQVKKLLARAVKISGKTRKG